MLFPGLLRGWCHFIMSRGNLPQTGATGKQSRDGYRLESHHITGVPERSSNPGLFSYVSQKICFAQDSLSQVSVICNEKSSDRYVHKHMTISCIAGSSYCFSLD